MEEQKIWTRDFIIMGSSNILYSFGFYMLLPTIPLYIVSLGGTDAQVGLVATAFSISSVLIRFLINVLFGKADKKKTLIGGMLLTAVVIALFTFSHAIWSISVLRIVQGLGFGIVTTFCATLVADLLPDSRRGEGIGLFGMGTISAAAIAPSIGLFLAASYGYRTLFLVTAIGPFLGYLGVHFYSSQSCAAAAVQEEGKPEKPLDRFFDRRLLIQTVLLLLMGVSRSADMNFISLFAEQNHISHLSWYYIVQTAASFSLRGFIGKVSDRRGHIWSMIPGACATFCYLLILSLAHSTVPMLFAGLFSGIGLGALVPSIQSWLFTSVEPEKRRIASATYYNFYDIGMAIGSILLGALAGAVGYSMMFRVTLICPVLFLVVYISYMIKQKNRRENNLTAAAKEIH